jgi:hypothetical protein
MPLHGGKRLNGGRMAQAPGIDRPADHASTRSTPMSPPGLTVVGAHQHIDFQPGFRFPFPTPADDEGSDHQ